MVRLNRSTVVLFDRISCSHVVQIVVNDGVSMRSPAATVLIPSEPRRSAVSRSKLSTP